MDDYVSSVTSQNKQYEISDERARREKLDKADLPTELSAFENDCDFVDKAVNDLENYYSKSDSYSKTQLDEIFSDKITFLIVETLPTQDISTSTIYFVPRSGSNTFDEYIYTNNAWGLIGNTDIDLSNYYTKTETDSKISTVVTAAVGDEEEAREAADSDLQDAIDDVADDVSDLADSLAAEVTARGQLDVRLSDSISQLSSALSAEVTRATEAEETIDGKIGNYDEHVEDKNNPHEVTKEQIGLGNVTNVATTKTITSGSQENITSGAVYTALNNKVDKVTGKGLSDQNYTYTEKTKLAGLENYDDTVLSGRVTATENAIETLNGDTTVTGSVDKKIADAISGVQQISYVIVSELPETGAAGVIYFVLDETMSGENKYNEYVWINNNFELVGQTTSKIDLSDYLTEAQTRALLSTKNDKITVTDDTSDLTDSDSFDETPAGANPTSTKRRLLTSLWIYIKGKITGAISGIVDSNLTASRALVSDSNGKVAVSDVTSTELGYLDGAKSYIQGQIDDINKSYPVDPILHYSFDEVPDLPDGPAIYRPPFVDNTESWNSSNCTVTCQNGIMSIKNTDEQGFSINRTFSDLDNCYVSFEIRCADNKNGDYIIHNNTTLVQNFSVEPSIALNNGQWQKIVYFLYNVGQSDITIDFSGNSFSSRSYEIRNFYIGNGSFSTPLIDNARKFNVADYKGFFINKSFRLDNNKINTGKCPTDITGNGYSRGYSISMTLNVVNGLTLGVRNRRILFSKENAIVVEVNNNNIKIYIWTNNNTWQSYTVPLIELDTSYFHLVIVSSFFGLNVYQNGLLSDSFNIQPAVVSDKDLYIGDYTGVYNADAAINIIDFQVFDYCLQSASVEALFRNIGNTPKYYTLADYENEQLSQSKADKVLNATNGHLASLDSSGNLTDSGKSASDFLPSDTPIPAAQVNSDWNSTSGVSQILNKPTLGTASSKDSTSSVTSGSTDLVESGAVADKIQNITDIASSLPTDAVLHYSFDEVPDYPDGTAIEKHIKDFTSVPSWWNSNNNGVLSVANGELVNTISGTNPWIRRNFSSPTSGIVKVKVRATADCSVLALQYYKTIYVSLAAIYDAKANQEYTLTAFMPSTSFLLLQAVVSVSTNFQLIISEIYIGDGSYSTPIIDNSNGQNNATNNGGIATNGVSGKGLFFVEGAKKEISVPFDFNGNTLNEWTISFWINLNEGSQTTGMNPRIYIFGSLESLYINNLYKNYSGNREAVFYTYYNSNEHLQVRVPINPYVNIGKFTHIVVTTVFNLNGTTTKKVYFNGALVDSATTTSFTNRPNLTKKSIGGTNDPAQNQYLENSQIDDFQIFDRALSETEVQALYLNKANTPKYYDLSDYKMPSKQNSELSAPITIAGQSYTTVESALSALAAQLSN